MNYEEKARELTYNMPHVHISNGEECDEYVADFLESFAEQVRRETLEEAAKGCDARNEGLPFCDCASHIRSLNQQETTQ